MPVIQRRSFQSAGAPIKRSSSPNSPPPTLFGFRIRRQLEPVQPLPEAGVPPVEGSSSESSDAEGALPSSDEEGESSAEEDAETVAGNDPALLGNAVTAGTAAGTLPSSDEGEESAEEDADTVAGNDPALQGNAATAGTAAGTDIDQSGGTVEGAATIDPAQPAQPAPNKLGVGPIIGIVFGVFALLVFIGLFLYRRRMIRKRKTLRGKWAIKPFEIGSPKDFRKGDDDDMMRATQSMVQVSAIAALPSPNFGRGSGSTDSPPMYLSKPPVGGRNRIAPDFKFVKQVFDATRPDELQVDLGDRLRVLKEYDDGWAQCVNMSAPLDAGQDRKQGMVPMACWAGDDVGSGGAGAEESGRGIGLGDDEKKRGLSRRESSLRK